MKEDIQPGFTRQYWSNTELAKGLHVSRGHLYRMLELGQLLGPDVVIAPESYGWDPNRARRFGVESDRLDADFRPIGPPPDGSLAKAATLAKTRYSVTPKLYLSSWMCSYVYGLQKNAVYFMRSRPSGFIPADVMIAPKKFGWSETRVIEFGEQTGRLDDEGIDKWAVRRTQEFGLAPDAAWVKKRIAERPHLEKRVAQALEQWHAANAAAGGQ